jgi:hypothetical protein
MRENDAHRVIDQTRARIIPHLASGWSWRRHLWDPEAPSCRQARAGWRYPRIVVPEAYCALRLDSLNSLERLCAVSCSKLPQEPVWRNRQARILISSALG